MRMLSRFLLSLLLITTILGGSVQVFASDSHIDIGLNGSNGITINPGTYPDLGSSIDDVQTAAAKKVVDKGKFIAQTITSICTLVCFVSLIVSISKLSTSSGMPILRRQAILGLLWSGISLSLFGGSWIVVTFFWNMFS